MTPSSHSFAGLQHYAMGLHDFILPGVWPVQGNMSSLWAVLLIASFVWIISRLISVFHKPTPEIEELLGQDIPPVPEIALSSVGTDSIVLYWKLPDNYHTPVKNYVHVNGVRIARNDGTSPTVTVPGLVPGHRYTIRAVSTNNAGYTSYSQPMHVQVTPAEGHRAARLLSSTDPSQGKRPSTGGRRVSSAPSESEKDARLADGATRDGSDAGDIVSKLTKRLEILRSENEDLSQQLEEEVGENEQSKATLVEERDRLKKQHDDKDRAWQESRKHLNDLEKQSKAAQRKKSKKESEVQQKKKKRQQMKEEMGTWSAKQTEMREETEKLRRDRDTVEEKHASKLADAKKAIEDAQSQGRSLEDEIREWGIKIKALEEEKRLADEREEEEEQEADRLEKEVESAYQVRLQDLEVRYQEVYGANLHVHNRLQQLQQLQQREPHRFAPTPISDYAYPAYVPPRSTRGSVSRASTLPYQATTTYAAAAPTSFAPVQHPSPAFSTPFPALSGIDTLGASTDRLGVPQHEFEGLTGGAQMSPSADELLPSNLLNDDLNSTLRPRIRPSILDSAFRADGRAQDPQSPSSQHSGARNFFQSPTSDVPTNMDDSNGFKNPDIDRALNNLNDAAPRRAGGIFNFNSRRGQKSLREGPALGTLTQGESQSFPRDFDDEEDVAPRGHQKQISNPWMNVSGFLSRGNVTTDDISLTSSKEPLPRKSRRLFSSTKFDTNDPFYKLDRTSSPRPASTYSYDQQLLRPSSESHPFPFSATDHLRLRSSPMGAEWSSLGGGAYSNNHSRRQSIHHGSTSNLSLGSTPLDFDDMGNSVKPAPVAPIGAGRPGKSRKQKLNPGAPSFISNVFSRSESKRTPKSDRGAFDSPTEGRRRSSLDMDPMTPSAGGYDDSSSPPVSRLSRDGHSIITNTTDSHDSVGGESDVTGTGSSTTGTGAGSHSKEGFMSRLTRKSSSTKFWGGGTKDRKGHSHSGSISGSMSRRKSSELPITPSEADEDAGIGGDYLGKTESNASTPIEAKSAARAALSWGKMMGKKSKKADSSAMSETSETREDEAE